MISWSGDDVGPGNVGRELGNREQRTGKQGQENRDRKGQERTVGTGSTRHRVAVVGGDGIGPEVCAEALKVVTAAGVDLDTTEFDLGAARFQRDGAVLPDETLEELRGFDAI